MTICDAVRTRLAPFPFLPPSSHIRPYFLHWPDAGFSWTFIYFFCHYKHNNKKTPAWISKSWLQVACIVFFYHGLAFDGLLPKISWDSLIALSRKCITSNQIVPIVWNVFKIVNTALCRSSWSEMSFLLSRSHNYGRECAHVTERRQKIEGRKKLNMWTAASRRRGRFRAPRCCGVKKPLRLYFFVLFIWIHHFKNGNSNVAFPGKPSIVHDLVLHPKRTDLISQWHWMTVQLSYHDIKIKTSSLIPRIKHIIGRHTVIVHESKRGKRQAQKNGSAINSFLVRCWTHTHTKLENTHTPQKWCSLLLIVLCHGP